MQRRSARRKDVVFDTGSRAKIGVLNRGTVDPIERQERAMLSQ
jgi:hypothetical protein